MSWKIFMATFWLVFIAELGDKTQLAVMAQSATHGRAIVFWAASAALVCSVVLGVFVGGLLTKIVSERVLNAVGGVMFLIFGSWMLFSAFRSPPASTVETPCETTTATTAATDDA
jgi:putative Ca2+/H+ antiporter (TMEM165/GDT1 family)